MVHQIISQCRNLFISFILYPSSALSSSPFIRFISTWQNKNRMQIKIRFLSLQHPEKWKVLSRNKILSSGSEKSKNQTKNDKFLTLKIEKNEFFCIFGDFSAIFRFFRQISIVSKPKIAKRFFGRLRFAGRYFLELRQTTKTKKRRRDAGSYIKCATWSIVENGEKFFPKNQKFSIKCSVFFERMKKSSQYCY